MRRAGGHGIPVLGKANPCPTSNPWEVRSPSGLEGVFADRDDAEFHADELRREGVSGVVVDRRQRRPAYGQAAATAIGNPSSRLFTGIYPTGIVYADRQRERDGDYLTVARLPFSSLQLEWTPGTHPRELREQIEREAAKIIARRGQEFQVSWTGQTVVLGKRNPAGLTAKGERMYEHIKKRYEAEGEPRAREIASRTVLSAAARAPGLKKKARR